MGYETMRSISVSKEIKIDRETLWSTISTSEILNDCHPYCSTNQSIMWDDVQRQDRLVYLNGRTYVRNFTKWNEGVGFELEIGDDADKQSHVRWEITSDGTKTSTLTITVTPFLLKKYPAIISFLPFHFWIKPRLTSYLQSVIGGFQYHIEEKKVVPRNHFGKHPWFS
tara:strand:+ start:48 stop:551 length:504 start_codon:yes stop_codon:yes gene_type:complete